MRRRSCSATQENTARSRGRTGLAVSSQRIADADDLDAEAVELQDGGEVADHAAAEAVEAPDDEGLELGT
jgi:hypothetical protein